MAVKQKKRRRLIADTPMTFGRFAGRPLRLVPRSYLRWVLDESDADDGTKWLVRQYMGQRHG